MMLMTMMMPLAMEIQSKVIEKYGFEPNQMSLMMFSACVQQHQSDPEVDAMAKQLKAMFLGGGM